MSNSVSDQPRKATTKRQTRAAWQVLLRRPLALGILLTLFPLYLGILSIFEIGPLAPRLRTCVPSYTGTDEHLRDLEDFRRYFASGETDMSIVGIDFTRASLELSDGTSYLALNEIQDHRSVPREADAVPFEQAGKLMLQFPNVRWIRFSDHQLRVTSPAVLNRLRKLTTIALISTDVDADVVETVSQISALQHVSWWAFECDVDLTPLKNLPRLESVHLEIAGRPRHAEAKSPLLSHSRIRELAQIPNLEELSLQTDITMARVPTHGDVLGEAESEAVAELGRALSSAGNLRRVYVGYQDSGAARQGLRELSAAVPQATVRAAWHDSNVGEKVGLSLVMGFFGVMLAGLHMVTCCSLPQAVLLPGSQAGHRRVFHRVVFVLLCCQLLYLMTAVGASLLAGIAICCVVVAPVLVMVNTTFISEKSTHTVAGILCKAAAFGSLCVGLAILVFVLMGNEPRLEWFLHGEQPVIAAVIVAVALFAVRHVESNAGYAHRYWTEVGMAPAASLLDFSQCSVSQKRTLTGATRIERAAAVWEARTSAGWQARLHALAGTGTSTFGQRVRAIKLWMLASATVRLRPLLLVTIGYWLLIMLVPQVVTEFLRDGVLRAPSSGSIALITAMLMLGCTGFGAVALYCRFPMFSNEVLLPVSREKWRETSLLSVLLISVATTFAAWLSAYVLRFAIADRPDLAWMCYSFLGMLAFSFVGAGLAAWLVIVRRVLFSAVCLALLITAVVPVAQTMMEGRNPSGRIDSPLPIPEYWLPIILTELVAGLIIFGLAWRRWARMELAT